MTIYNAYVPQSVVRVGFIVVLIIGNPSTITRPPREFRHDIYCTLRSDTDSITSSICSQHVGSARMAGTSRLIYHNIPQRDRSF